MAVDVSEELVQEMSDLRAIHVANFGEEQLHPIDLLNNLQKTKLQTLFPNCRQLCFNYFFVSRRSIQAYP